MIVSEALFFKELLQKRVARQSKEIEAYRLLRKELMVAETEKQVFASIESVDSS